MTDDPRLAAVPDIHGHAKGEHKLYVDERPIPYTARMLFLWFFHACRRGAPRFLMVADHINYLTFEDPAAVNLVRRALKLAQAGDLYGAAETAGVEVNHAAVVGEGLRRGMRYSIGAEVDNDPRSRPDAQNIVDAMRPDGMLRSVHFLPIKHPQFGENWMWPFDNPEFRDLYDVVGTEGTWELYMATLLDAIEKLPGNIVGHFYVPAKFGHWPADDVLERYEDQLLEACAARGMAVEINTRYFYKHASDDGDQLERYRAAHVRLLRKAKEKNVSIAVGSDAHSPKDQGNGFAEVLALLDLAEINEIAFPIDGRLARVALRATDELRRASALAAREARPEAVPIPGTEEVEQDEDADEPAQSVTQEPEAVVAVKAVPKKRPSRAKKPVEAAAPSPVEPAVSPETQPVPAMLGEAAEVPAEGLIELTAAVEASAAETSDLPDAPLEVAAPAVPAVPAAPDASSEPDSAPERPPTPPRKRVAPAASREPAKPVRAAAHRPAKRTSKATLAKAPARSKSSAGAGKAASVAKKTASKPPAAKKKTARTSRAGAPTAKKAAGKKAPARKPLAKATGKVTARTSAKKAGAKKPAAKKKATKSRR